MKLNWNFQRGVGGGGGLGKKIPSVGEVWIFSGITHSIKQCANPPIENISRFVLLGREFFTG